MKRTPRRERQVSRIRLDILEAAAGAFARGGFKATTMQKVAREAGYTAAALYTYFPSKDAIFWALVDLVASELLETFSVALPRGLTFLQRFELLVRRQLDLADRRRDAFAVLFAVHSGEDAIPCRKPARRTTGGFELYAGHLTKWIAENSTNGEIGERDPAVVATFFMGIAHAFFLEWLRGAKSGRLADRLDLVMDLFLYGVKGGRTGARRGR